MKVAYVLAQKHYRKVVIKTIRYSTKILDNKTHNIHQFLQNCVNDSTNVPTTKLPTIYNKPYKNNYKGIFLLKKKKGKEKREKPSLWEREEINIPNKHSAHFNPIPKYPKNHIFYLFHTKEITFFLMASKPPVFNNHSDQAVPKFNHQSQAQVGSFCLGLLVLVFFVQPCIQEKKNRLKLFI